jgi:hypothetical protein
VDAVVLFDLGLSASTLISARLGGACYDNNGLYFQLEAYKSDGTGVDSQTAANGSNGSNVPTLKRFKQSGGIVAVGGTFRELVHKNLQCYVGAVPGRSHLNACGVKFRLDSLNAIVTRAVDTHNKSLAEATKQRRSQDESRNRSTEEFFSLSNTCVDVLVLVSVEAADTKVQTSLFIEQAALLSQLRILGLNAVECIHQFQGLTDYFDIAIPASAASGGVSLGPTNSSAGGPAVNTSSSSSAAPMKRYSSTGWWPKQFTEHEALAVCSDFGVPMLVLVDSVAPNLRQSQPGAVHCQVSKVLFQLLLAQ